MKKGKRKGIRLTKVMFVACLVAFVVGSVALNSYESSLNIDCQNLEKEIAIIESDIDGLDLKKIELTSFARLEAIAKEKGYDYKQSTMTAAVVGVQRD